MSNELNSESPIKATTRNFVKSRRRSSYVLGLDLIESSNNLIRSISQSSNRTTVHPWEPAYAANELDHSECQGVNVNNANKIE